MQWEQQTLLMHPDQQELLSALPDRAPRAAAAKDKQPGGSLPRIATVSAA